MHTAQAGRRCPSVGAEVSQTLSPGVRVLWWSPRGMVSPELRASSGTFKKRILSAVMDVGKRGCAISGSRWLSCQPDPPR